MLCNDNEANPVRCGRCSPSLPLSAHSDTCLHSAAIRRRLAGRSRPRKFDTHTRALMTGGGAALWDCVCVWNIIRIIIVIGSVLSSDISEEEAIYQEIVFGVKYIFGGALSRVPCVNKQSIYYIYSYYVPQPPAHYCGRTHLCCTRVRAAPNMYKRARNTLVVHMIACDWLLTQRVRDAYPHTDNVCVCKCVTIHRYIYVYVCYRGAIHTPSIEQRCARVNCPDRVWKAASACARTLLSIDNRPACVVVVVVVRMCVRSSRAWQFHMLINPPAGEHRAWIEHIYAHTQICTHAQNKTRTIFKQRRADYPIMSDLSVCAVREWPREWDGAPRVSGRTNKRLDLSSLKY